MSLDERLRDELRGAVEPRPLREDDAFDRVRLRHRRLLVRRGVTRQASVAAVVVSLFASAAMVVAWRNVPDRYRSTTTVRVAAKTKTTGPSTTSLRTSKATDPKTLALAPSTRRAALLAAHVSTDGSHVDFRAMLNPTRDLLLFAATAPTATESNAVTRSWATAYITARRADAIRQLRASNLALERRVRALHQQFRAVDAELKRLDPTYYSKLGYGGPYGVPFGVRDPAGPTQVRKHATVHELNLWNERIRFLRQLADAGAEAARSHIVGSGPNVVSTVVAQSPAVRVSETAPAAVLVLLSWAIGLAVALVGAIILYRRRTGAMSQVSV